VSKQTDITKNNCRINELVPDVKWRAFGDLIKTVEWPCWN